MLDVACWIGAQLEDHLIVEVAMIITGYREANLVMFLLTPGQGGKVHELITIKC